MPRCPFGNECGHTLTSIEVIQIFGRNSKFHKLYTELEIQNTLASDTKSFLACPQPNCKAYCFEQLCKCCISKKNDIENNIQTSTRNRS